MGQSPAVRRLQEQCPVLLFTPSTSVDSQENTTILSWAMPRGDEPPGAQPRQEEGPEREEMGKMEAWRHPNGLWGKVGWERASPGQKA